MRSGTSSFKFRGWFSPTLFRKNLHRFWPILALYTAILIFLLPVETLSEARYGGRLYAARASDIVTQAITAAPFLGLIFGLLLAMAFFSYLMDRRATQMLHALPIRREGLFLTNWLSGLCFLMVPNLAVGVVTALVQLAVGGGPTWHLLAWFAVETVVPMFFFCFGIFCAMFTGNLLALPIFYGILNVLVVGVTGLVDLILPDLLVGSSGSFLSASVPVRWCTPVYQISYLLYGMYGFTAQGAMAALCYSLVLGAAFTLAALGVYRLRQLERAGDLVTVAWVRPVFQYGLGICLGLSLGLFLQRQFFYFTGSYGLIALIVLCGALGAFIGRMLLKKTLRVFADGWKGVLVMSLALGALLVGVRSDFFGYQRYVPEVSQVRQVTVRGLQSAPWDSGSYLELTTEDSALIEQIIGIHQGLVEDLDRLRGYDQGYYTVDRELNTSFYVTYELANGRGVSRSYSTVPITAEDLADPDSYAARMEAFLNERDCVLSSYFSGVLEEGETLADLEVGSGWISDLTTGPAAGTEQTATEGPADEAVPTTEAEWDSPTLSAQEAQLLWSAIQEDLAAGRIGRRYLLSGGQERKENCYLSDIGLTMFVYRDRADGTRTSVSADMVFTVQKTATATLAALEELGYASRLVPWQN